MRTGRPGTKVSPENLQRGRAAMTETSRLKTDESSPTAPWEPTPTEVAAIGEGVRASSPACAERYAQALRGPEAATHAAVDAHGRGLAPATHSAGQGTDA